MAETDPFKYTTQLAKGEIRLLSLMPSPTPTSQPAFQSPLRFSLQTTTLPSSPATTTPTTPYIALSYVWGTALHPTPILVNDRPFTVTRNLHAALLHLSTHELRSRPLWADALCINQADAAEKTAQIARMADVYRGAERVVVFLGAGTPRIRDAFPQMERIGGAVLDAGAMVFREPDLKAWPGFEGCEERERKVEVRVRLERMMDRERGGVLFGKPGLDGNAVLDLCGGPWFARAWVIQEICLARVRDGAVVFACGDRRITWERLWGAHLFLALWILREGKAMGESESFFGGVVRLGLFVRRLGMVPRPFSARAAQTLGTRKKFLQGDLDRSLKGLLKTFYVGDSQNPLGSRDPEDKVRALLGLASDGHVCDEILSPTASWQQVYTSLARYFYSQKDLDFLSLCRGRSPTLPSWVTDWTQQQRPPWLGFADAIDSPLFTAGKGTEVQIYDDENAEQVLCLGGFAVDTIQEVGSVWTAGLDEEFNWESARLRIIEIDRFLSISKLYSPSEKIAARWRIIIADRIPNDVQQYVRATTDSVAEESFAKLEAIANTWSPRGKLLGAWYFSYRNALLSLWSSRPFISSKGYVGLCPGNAAEGNTVFIPSGSHCPYVIKRSDRAADQGAGVAWELLGEAYVHGVMDGELDLGNGATKAQRFRLF